jgi:hypothetical protein
MMYLRDLKSFLIKLKINSVEKIKELEMIKVCEYEFFEFNTYIQTLKIIHETSPTSLSSHP